MSRARERLYRTEGIIVRRTDTGEADRILTLYTPDRGKLHLVARGVRRPGSRLAGHLELLSHSTFLIARARTLDIVTQAQTLHAFAGIRQDLERIGWACYLAELVERLTVEAENEPVFALLLEALEYLEQGRDAELLARSFELHLLGYLGYRPQVFCCVSCEEPLEPRAHTFSASLGGVLCPQCRERDRRARPLSLEALKVLRYLLRNGLGEATRLRLNAARRREVEEVLHDYIRAILEREPNSVAVLQTLRNRPARGEER